MTKLLTKLATARHRRVLLTAGALFVLAAALGAPVTGMLGSSSQDFQDPASQYERANDALRAATGQNPYFNLVVLIPIKALIMNTLSVSVAVGLQVLIFQDGHLPGLLGFTPLGGLEESTLVLMLILAFALATDYEVFVLARIKEAHDNGLPNRQAIALGIERTGRIVTAAARAR